MLISLYREFVSRSLDLIITKRFKVFRPHNEEISKEKRMLARELNTSYYMQEMTNLVGGAITEARIRIPVLDQISLALTGMLVVTAVALVISFGWTAVTAVCIPMIMVSFGLLGYVLFQGKDMIKAFYASLITNDLSKMAVGQSVLFIARIIGLEILLMGAVVVAHPFMLLLLILGVAFVIYEHYMDISRLMLHMENRDIGRNELNGFIKVTGPLYSAWALSQFEDSLSRGVRLTIAMVQRHQLHTDTAE